MKRSIRQAECIEEVPPLLTRDKLGHPVGLAGYRRVRDETGAVHTLINGALNRTDAKVGDQGVVVRIESPTVSLWRFVANKDNEEGS